MLALASSPRQWLRGAAADESVPDRSAQSGPSSSQPSPSMEAFRQGLRDLGYVEGQNLVIEWRWGEGREERLPTWRPSWSGSRWR